MANNNRREFLTRSAAGAAAAAVLNADPSTQAAGAPTPAAAAMPPHCLMPLIGLHAYAEKSIAAGQAVHFRTSSDVPYRLSVCRLSGDVDGRSDDEVLHTFPQAEPSPQTIHPGSYIHVPTSLPAREPLSAVTLECWVRAWRFGGFQGLVTQYDAPESCGIGLFFDSDGRPRFYLGSGGSFDESRMVTGSKMELRRWFHLAGTWDGHTAVVWIDGKPVATHEHSAQVLPSVAALRLAASGEHGEATHFLDGDLAMPCIYNVALTAAQIQQRYKAEAQYPPAIEHLLACWPFSEEDGSRVADVGPHARHGEIINHATWMIGGPSFRGENVARFAAAYDPARDSLRGHALRFASDDLLDCHWRTTHEFEIPQDAQSGVYVGRYDYRFQDKPCEYFVTFVVRRPADRPKAPILMLCSSSTWLAYNAAPFPIAVDGPHHVGTDGLKSCVADAPDYSCYRNHQGGQPTYYMGLNVPWPIAGPNVLYSPRQVGYSHLMRAELFTHRWLDGQYDDKAQYRYDVVTDLDLHRDPDLLNGYKTLIINGHSEYWSTEAYEGVDQYLTAGGTVIALSGNTMFWRTSFNSDSTVMECRKYDSRIGGRPGATIGELYHSDDGRRGSLMRLCGYPAWRVIGLECCGWSGYEGVYHTETPDHVLFQTPEPVGLSKDETFGHARDAKFPQAVGHEWDVRLSTLKRMTQDVPKGAQLPEQEPEGITTLARGITNGRNTRGYFGALVPDLDGLCAEMIYWERPQGGRVFHAGAIAAGWALSADPKLRTLLRNVLFHFGVQPSKATRGDT